MGKKIIGKKRHILSDKLGLLLHAFVDRAEIQDRDAGIFLLAALFGMYPFLKTLFADGGYQGPEFKIALAEILPYSKLNRQALRSRQRILWYSHRWVVDRTMVWLNRCRRLAKDWDNLNRKALAFLRLASVRLMFRKLCNPVSCFRTDS